VVLNTTLFYEEAICLIVVAKVVENRWQLLLDTQNYDNCPKDATNDESDDIERSRSSFQVLSTRCIAFRFLKQATYCTKKYGMNDSFEMRCRDVVLGTRTRTRVLLEYNFQVLVLVLVLDTWVLVLVLVLAVNISTRTRTCTRSACTNIILPILRKLKLSH
jgi:hypothetical protein